MSKGDNLRSIRGGYQPDTDKLGFQPPKDSASPKGDVPTGGSAVQAPKDSTKKDK